MPAAQPGLLEGVTVLDFSEQVPGPNATRVLSGLGADVIKIERLDGDRLRHRPAMFEAENRGKRSVAVDLKTDRGRAAALRLVAGADMVVEGYRPGVMDRLGLGFTDAQAVNPRVIYVSISGYGADGPYRDLPGHDFQFLSAVGAIPAPTPETVDTYIPTTLPIADLGASVYSTIAMLMALYQRLQDPVGWSGCHIDVAMSDCVLAMMEPRIAEALTIHTTDGALARPGYGIFQTGDGRFVTVGALEDHFWRRLVSALELPALASEGYATFAERRQRAQLIDRTLRPRIASFTRDALVALLGEHDVPVAPLNDLLEPVHDQHFRSRAMVVECEASPTVRVAEWPVALNPFADRARLTPAPGVGQHSREVLRQAGVPVSEIDELVAAGIVVDRPPTQEGETP